MPNPTDEMIEAACLVVWDDLYAARAGSWKSRSDDEVIVIQLRATMRAALSAALTVTEGAWRRQLAVPPVRRRRREATINAKVIDQLTRSIQRNVRLIKTLEATKEYIISGGDQPAILARIRSTLLNEE